MRILVVTHYFWPESFRINDLVEELTRRGHQITVLAGPPSYPEGEVYPEFRRDPKRFSNYHGADVLRIPVITRGRNRFRLALNYLSAMVSAGLLAPVRLRGRPFDAILVFLPSPFTTCLPALLLGRLKRAPVLPWVLDLWPDTLSAVGAVRQSWLLALVGWMVAFAYRRCGLVLVPSRAFIANIEAYLGDRSRIRYFPGWAEPLFQGRLAEVEPAPEVRPYQDSFNVMFAGNIGQAQDFPAILDAADTLRARADIRWLIVGDGRMGDWVRREIDRRDLGERVKMFGRHPVERMPSFFRAAGAMLVSLKSDPAFAKTIPGRVQTFLMSGLPIVGMLDGEGARLIEESGAGLVCPAGDGAALAGCVERLASMSAGERAAMGAQGLDYARREFDRNTLLSRLEQWMAAVAGTGDALGG